jgi:homoserine kinase type II
MIEEKWAECSGRSKGTVFDAYVQAHLDLVRRGIHVAGSALSVPGADLMPQIVIHCDYHPGNLKFEGDRVTGLFDFDWAKVDWRAFDVALAVWYFCTSWEGASDGQVALERAGVFLRAYQDHLRQHAGLGPLSGPEAGLFASMISAANLYVLNWTIMDFCGKDVDPQEYLVYLRHSVNFAVWFEAPETRRRIERTLGEL